LISAGAPPLTPAGELAALPQIPTCIRGGLTTKGNEKEKGKGRRVKKGRGKGGEKKREGEEEDERGKYSAPSF